MSSGTTAPFIGPAEQRLFEIADTRERADRLRDELTPKLAHLLDIVLAVLEEAYGEELLEPYRISLTPAHRPDAKRTKEFHEAKAALAIHNIHWYFQQNITCDGEIACVAIHGLRGNEANPLTTVLQRHRDRVIGLLEAVDGFMLTEQVPENFERDNSIGAVIDRLSMRPERDWGAGLEIVGPLTDLPLPDVESAWPIVYGFVALFPIFRAATDIILGRQEKFLEYVQLYEKWDASLDEVDSDEGATDRGGGAETSPTGSSPTAEPREDPVAVEGFDKVALQRHRTRERRLRKLKIRDALRHGDGRLRCEVPGCGFDFFEVYGEIGKHFAHVHHLTPLADPAGPRKTRLSDLAIVCANCHAVIHRGGMCHPIHDLIKKFGVKIS